MPELPDVPPIFAETVDEKINEYEKHSTDKDGTGCFAAGRVGRERPDKP
jgi:hypothetical protein